jgi:small subunit ribosomal protein S15
LKEADVESDDESDDEMGLYEIYEDSLDIKIPHDLIAELTEKEAIAAANKKAPLMETHKANINAAVERWRQHENDVGSAEVQIATAHERIKYLTSHLLANKNDIATRRGLNMLVNTRRRLLNYLYKTNLSKAQEMIRELGIRFKPPGRLWDKEVKYAAFKNTKNKKAEAKKIAKIRAREAVMAN